MHACARPYIAAIALAVLCLHAGGCATDGSGRRELGSGNPLDRARGIVQVAEAQDPRALHRVVDLLEDPDEAVRMYAITALRRLCGEDLGYRFYASEAQRAAAVARWREALRTGQVSFRSRQSASPESQPTVAEQRVETAQVPAKAAGGGAP